MSAIALFGVEVGHRATHHFVVTTEDMTWFAGFSGDRSYIHTERAFCERHGFQEPVVYGALMLAHLSHVLGMKIPGLTGVSSGWDISFHNPLYVGEEATIEAEVVHISESTRSVKIKFRISKGDTLVAQGKTQSVLLEATA
jgi:acyl dehydratase